MNCPIPSFLRVGSSFRVVGVLAKLRMLTGAVLLSRFLFLPFSSTSTFLAGPLKWWIDRDIPSFHLPFFLNPSLPFSLLLASFLSLSLSRFLFLSLHHSLSPLPHPHSLTLGSSLPPLEVCPHRWGTCPRKTMKHSDLTISKMEYGLSYTWSNSLRCWNHFKTIRGNRIILCNGIYSKQLFTSKWN